MTPGNGGCDVTGSDAKQKRNDFFNKKKLKKKKKLSKKTVFYVFFSIIYNFIAGK